MQGRQNRTAAEHFWRRGVEPTVDITQTTDNSASLAHRLHRFTITLAFGPVGRAS